MALTPTELTYLRSQRPFEAEVEWFMAMAPYGAPCFTARINDAGIARGDTDIVYDGDAGELNVEEGMTLWVGSTGRAYDIGRIRIRDINTATNTITVAENDNVAWADDLYLTCPGAYGFRELWSKMPYVDESGANPVFYEDRDVLFSAPLDTVLPPKANAGSPACADIGDDGYVDVEFVGDESYTPEVGAALATYLWDFTDGVVVAGAVNAVGTEAVPNVVRFTTAGFRYITLTVTDNTAQSRTHTVHVPVWIFDDDNPPITNVEVKAHRADPSHSITVIVFDDDAAEMYNYPDGALVVIYTQVTYNGVQMGISNGFPYREDIRFVGWLDSESLTFDYEAGSVIFKVISHDTVMGRLPGFTMTQEDTTPATDWYEIQDLNLDRALHALLVRRSTVNDVCHVNLVGDGATRPLPIQPYPDASLYSQATDHLLTDAMGTLLSDRQGILKATRDPQFMSDVQRGAVDVVCTLGYLDDFMGDIDESRKHSLDIGYVRIGGYDYDTPLLSRAPGVARAQAESEFRSEGFIFEDQDEANRWSGQMYSKMNNDFKSVPVELAGYWPTFDPANQEYVRLTIVDPLGRNVVSNDRFIVREVEFDDLMEDAATRTYLTLEREAPQFTGETMTVPTAPTPSWPSPPPFPTPPPGWTGALEKVILRTTQGIFVTKNFDEAVPGDVFWEASNNSLDANERENIRDMAFDRADGDRLFMVNDHVTDGGVFRCNNIWNQAAWEDQFDNDYAWMTIDTAAPIMLLSPIPIPYRHLAAGIFWSICCDPVTGYLTLIGGYHFVSAWGPDRHKRAFYSQDALATLPLGDHLMHDPLPATWGDAHANTDWAGSGASSSQGESVLLNFACAWGAGSHRRRAVSADAGATVDNTCVAPNPAPFNCVWGLEYNIWHTRVGDDVIFYTSRDGIQVDDIAISADAGFNFVIHEDVLPSLRGAVDSGQGLAMHFMDTGNVIIITDEVAGGVVWYSTDGAFTWAAAPVGSDNPRCVAPCADTAWPIPDGKGFIVGAETPAADTDWLYLTRDVGQTWENRTGNLGDFLDHTVDSIEQIIPVQEES